MSDVMFDEVDGFLEHFGIRGMKWGFRKARKGDWRTRSAGQKLGLVGGGLGGHVVGGVAGGAVGGVVGGILERFGLRGAGIAASKLGALSGSVGGTFLGARFTRNVLQKSGKKQLRSISRQVSDQEAVSRVREYLSTQPGPISDKQIKKQVNTYLKTQVRR